MPPRRMRRAGKAKATSVAALARKVNRLVRAKKAATQWLNLRRQEVNTSVAAQHNFNLCAYNAMTPVFGTGAEDLTDPKAFIHSMLLNIRVSLENTVNNEESTTRFSMFVVSLKDKVSSGVFVNNTGVLTLAQDSHYTVSQGIAYLNKKIFKIHNAKYFTLTNYDTALGTAAGQSQFGTAREFNIRIAPKMTIENPSGNWIAMPSSLDPSKQYYVLLFSDNQTGDLESPTISITQLLNVKKIASS